MKINTTYFKLKERRMYVSSRVGVCNSDLDVLPMTDKDVIFPYSNVISEMRADIRMAQDEEVNGEGNSVNYTFRMHDPRLGSFFVVERLAAVYLYYSPYQFSSNRPIDYIELEGGEPLMSTRGRLRKSKRYYSKGTGRFRIGFYLDLKWKRGEYFNNISSKVK